MSRGDGAALPYGGDPAMLSRLFDQLGCGMYTVEASGLITAMNAEGAALLGYDRADLLGRHAHETLHALRPDGSPYPVEQCPLLGVLRKGVRAEAASDAFLHADGSLVAVSWTSTPLSHGDRVDGAVVLFRGAVDQQRVEQQRTHALQAERLQRALMETAHQRLLVLAEITQALSSTLDAQEALARLTRLIVPRLADWCVVNRVDESGALHRVAVAHRDPAIAPRGKFERKLPSPATSNAPLARVLAGDELLAARWELLRELGGKHMIITPLSARGRVLGALTLGSNSPDEPFGDDDVALVEDIGRRVGLALDNAQLHAGQRDVAETLQRSLLTHLPDADHITLAARYLPAGAHSRVGGDWYDSFVLPDGCTTMVIGDIAGHDVEAAARMGQVRNILRGIAVDRTEPPSQTGRGLDRAVDRTPPSEIVRRLDRAVDALGAADYATVIFGKVELLDRQQNIRELAFTNAGHPPPLLVRTDGRVETLGAEPDLPLGVFPGLPRGDTRVLLPPGCTVLMYTDGLVEHRQENVAAGLARLRNAASRHAREPIEQFCDSLLADLNADASSDDIAVLALRVPDGAADRPVLDGDVPATVKAATGQPCETTGAAVE